MSFFFGKYWPPTRSCGLSIFWSLVFGFVLQFAAPFLVIALGFKDTALWAWLPGLLPIIWATGGWFAGISPIGYILMFTINTLAYGALVLLGLRACSWCRKRMLQA